MKENWPLIISTFPTKETESDVKLVKDIFLVATEATANIVLELLKKYSFCKAMRITALMHRFKHNFSQSRTYYKTYYRIYCNKGKATTEITSYEVDPGRVFSSTRVLEHRTSFNLPLKQDWILQFHESTRGDYPIFVQQGKVAKIMVEDAPVCIYMRK